MMRGERSFGRDVRIRSPPTRVGYRGGRDHSPPPPPPRRQPRNPSSPTRASTRRQDYRRNPRTGPSPPPAGRPSRDTRDYPRNPRAGSPPPVSRQSREFRDFSPPYDGSRERRSHTDANKSKGDYSLPLGDDREAQELSRFNNGFSPRDSPSSKFQWKHLYDESKVVNGSSNHSSKHYPEYGVGTTFAGMTTEKSYRSGGLAETGRSGMIGEKFLSMEVERGSNIPVSYPLESGSRSGYGIGGGDLSLQSQKLLNNDLHKNEDLWFRDKMPGDKLPARDGYKGEEFSKLYSIEEKPLYTRDSSRFVIPSSQSQGTSTVLFGRSLDNIRDSRGDGFTAHSDGFRRSSGVPADSMPHEADTRIPRLTSSRYPLLQLDNTTKYREVQHIGNHGPRGGGCTYPEIRGEKSEMASLSGKLYGKMAAVEDEYGHVNSLGSRRVDPIKDGVVVTEGSRREHVIGGMPWDTYHSSLERPISDYLDASGPLYVSKNDGDALDHGSIHHKYNRDAYRGHTNNYMREDHGYGRDASLQLEDEMLNMSSRTDYDPGLDGIDQSLQEGLTDEEEIELVEQPKRMPKRKLDVETELTRKNPRSKFPNKRNISGKIHNTISRTSVFSASRFRNNAGPVHGVGRRNHNPGAYGGPSRYSGLLKPNGRDIKKRLGPSFRDIKSRLGPVEPVPQQASMPQASAKKRKVQKFLDKDGDASHESNHAEGEGNSGGNMPPAKTEPREESDEFKQLVHGAFLKFVKQLNENPGQRRRLEKQGKAGSLKCTVCGSDSEEFKDTESLALHACIAPKVGLRAQHLAFHKAVCTIMGWKSAETLNIQWVCELLRDAENVGLKEDLIIWPPVVFIHDSSVGDVNPAGRVSEPVKMLESMLRDMGFAEKIELCHGKPASQGTMVVKFSSTFSGFREAEKLHNIFADKKHGRSEFRSINMNDTRKASVSKFEEFLYGYMGLAEDLDKLGFGTKKRCFVKSKKEIQELANAPLNNE